MSQTTESLGAAAASPRATRSRWRDWRIWVGLTITIVCMWWMLRGVPIDEVTAAMADADLLVIVALSLPAYVANLWFRAVRWRHLTNPITSIPRGMMFRAEAIGFMVNNLVPLRIGEVVRAWWLARQVGAPGMSILGTVALERVLDVVCLLALAGMALALMGSGQSAGAGLVRDGALVVGIGALLPLAVLVALRVAPEPLLRVAAFVTRPLPDALRKRLLTVIQGFANGLGALSGGTHLFWIVLHSIIIWVVASTVPIWAGVVAFDLDLGSPTETLWACWIMLAATGVAAAIPSAPGFFGPYQIAFKEVLERFGVDPATALGLGLLVWLVFWVIMTGLGFLVLRASKATLGELTRETTEPTEPEAR